MHMGTPGNWEGQTVCIITIMITTTSIIGQQQRRPAVPTTATATTITYIVMMKSTVTIILIMPTVAAPISSLIHISSSHACLFPHISLLFIPAHSLQYSLHAGSSTTTRAHLIEQEVQKRVVEEKLQGELRNLEEELLRTKRAAAERKATIENMLAATERAKQDSEFESRKKQMSVEERVAAEVARQVKLLGLDNDEDNDAPVLSSYTNMGERGSGGSPSQGLTRPRSEAGSNAPSVITEASPNGTPIVKAKKAMSAATGKAEVITVTASDAGNTQFQRHSTLYLPNH